MSGEQGVEEIARAAVVLCAELVRRYEHVDLPGSLRYEGMRSRYEYFAQVEEWGRQVLAWQDQLDQQTGDTP